MKQDILDCGLSKRLPSDTPLLTRLARRLVLSRLAGIREGTVTLIEGGRHATFGQPDADPSLKAVITVDDPDFYPAVAFGGSLASGEAWMAGQWRCDDLTALVRIMLRNREVLDGLDSRWSLVTAPAQKLAHWLNRNSRRGSRRNIAAHYDLGNELFSLFLDPTMMYSCAVYEQADMSLDQAAVAKIDLVCRKLGLTADDHLLEIGTGWGGLAIHAAREYGCRVTTTTLSAEQRALALERIAEAGLSHRIEVLLEDYRDLTGRYDKIVSIEMIEAVGHQWFDTYFSRCSELLTADGVMLLQAITIADQRYDAARRNVDFIKRYIFPGGGLPSVSAIADSIARRTDMRITHLEDIGVHYARTLVDWRARFFAGIERVRELNYPESFTRMWEFYLRYCEGAFLERAIGTVQVRIEKPRYRGAPWIGDRPRPTAP